MPDTGYRISLEETFVNGPSEIYTVEWELNVVPSAELCLGEEEFGTSNYK